MVSLAYHKDQKQACVCKEQKHKSIKSQSRASDLTILIYSSNTRQEKWIWSHNDEYNGYVSFERFHLKSQTHGESPDSSVPLGFTEFLLQCFGSVSPLSSLLPPQQQTAGRKMFAPSW